jgi:hypothetical protein
LRYLAYLVEPLLIYGGGFGALPIEWVGGWHYLYNIIGPGTALATVGWVRAVVPAEQSPEARSRLSALCMLSVLALLMLSKFLNRSIVGAWHVDALCSVAVLAWWIRLGFASLPDRTLLTSPLRFGTKSLAYLATAGLTLALLVTADDVRFPNHYALRAYVRYPSLLRSALAAHHHACSELDCVGKRIAQSDLDLIRDRTQAQARVAIFSPYDWAFLIDAQRPPKFTFLPSSFIFTRRQLADSIAGVDLLFLPREPSSQFGIEHPELMQALIPELREHFVREAEGEVLVAWRRKTSD